jgi:hypothetical protein
VVLYTKLVQLTIGSVTFLVLKIFLKKFRKKRKIKRLEAKLNQPKIYYEEFFLSVEEVTNITEIYIFDSFE